MSKKVWAFAMVAVGGLGGLLGHSVWPRAVAAPAETNPPIGRFVLVHDRVSNSALPLEGAELRTVGGKTFLVGTCPAKARCRTPAAGRPVWMNMEEASTIIHFESLDDLEKAVEKVQAPADN